MRAVLAVSGCGEWCLVVGDGSSLGSEIQATGCWSTGLWFCQHRVWLVGDGLSSVSGILCLAEASCCGCDIGSCLEAK